MNLQNLQSINLRICLVIKGDNLIGNEGTKYLSLAAWYNLLEMNLCNKIYTLANN